MSRKTRYDTIAGLATQLPMFPLPGAVLLPRGQLPLNVFEPRYLAMVDDVLATDRLLGVIQPLEAPARSAPGPGAQEPSPAANTRPRLYSVGCAGRLTSFTETRDGRVLISLTGVCRFTVAREPETTTPYRRCVADYAAFADDLKEGCGEERVDRDKLLAVLKKYLERHHLQADWNAIGRSSNEQLVNSLSIISPYGTCEKQALLEAQTLEKRNHILIVLTEMALAQGATEHTSLQ